MKCRKIICGTIEIRRKYIAQIIASFRLKVLLFFREIVYNNDDL